MALRKRGVEQGITLIELLVALAIVGVIFAVAATGLREAFDVALKSSASHLGALIRYLRTDAITKHRYFRLVLDLEKAEYSVEVSEEPFVISLQEEEENPSKGEEASAEEGISPEGKGGFHKMEGILVKPTRLGKGVFFKDVSVSYLKDKKEGGRVRLYFFPDGYTNAAAINLRDEDDEDHYSIVVQPLSGEVTIEGRTRELERE